jgi:macrolide-specific efflux system membrane fusion protein
MTVWAQTSEADVPKIKVGMPAYFNTLGEPTRRWYGKVRQVLPTPETLNNVILYDVLFDVVNPDLALKTQMSAQVFFVLAKADDVLLVPAAALNPIKANSKGGKKAKEATDTPGGSEKAYKVLVPDQDKTAEKTVTVGISNRLQAQVLSGLSEGDTVIVGPAVKAGSKNGSGGQSQKGMPGMGR